MPEYLAPGVYVEEVSFRSKSIEGVSTTTTGFIGPTRYGPLDLEPDVITSLGEFERVYGDRQQLVFKDLGGTPLHNFMWHAVRAFFEEGGKRLYVARTFNPISDADSGIARLNVPESAGDDDAVQMRARFPGEAGNVRVRLTLRVGQNLLSVDPSTNKPTVGALQNDDIVLIVDKSSPISSPPGAGTVYRAESFFDEATRSDTWRFVDRNRQRLELSALNASVDPAISDQIRVVTLTITAFPDDPEALPLVWSDLPLDPSHERFGSPDSFSAYFSPTPSNLGLARTLPISIVLGKNIDNGHEVLEALNMASANTIPNGVLSTLTDDEAGDADRSFDILLKEGNDGNRPLFTHYEGRARDDENFKTGLKALEDIEDISIVAAPGSTFGYENGYRNDATTIINLMISHAERMRYRIAVLDSGNEQTISQVRAMRAKIDSKYAAFYYPWVRVLDPVTRREIDLPPSGFVAGIYARNDINRAVYKAPANEVVTLAIGFEQLLNKSQQDVLNPEGVNCFRFFEGRGFRLWGARTTSSDPEWKYVNLRRYFAYLERSIDKGTQWAVFEPNGEALWANVRRTVEDFLLNEWMSGALLGDKPEKAFFVRCDRSTMTQNDLDNGRLICLIGVAPLRPAEFVIFRIGQWTADARR
jgi:hypothetical protein